VSKTCSGKIMRRILRKIRENLPGQLSDISTLADP
jgi:acetyl-CoA synthetase